MTMLEIKEVRTGYDAEVDVVQGASLTVNDNEIVALIGANGAGKSSLFKTISGILPVRSGEILYRGEKINGLKPHTIVGKGVIQVPEEGGTFTNLTIEENLMIACQRPEAKANRQKNLDTAYRFFPVLYEKRNIPAGSLSGGQRKMLSVSKAIMGQPELLLLDDISMGLAPKIVEDLYSMLKELTKELNIPVLVVEQIVDIALDFAERGYVMAQGRIMLEGSSADLRGTDEVKKLYIGG